MTRKTKLTSKNGFNDQTAIETKCGPRRCHVTKNKGQGLDSNWSDVTERAHLSQNKNDLLLDPQVVPLLLLALVVEQDVLPGAEPELQDVLLQNLDVLPRIDLLVVHESPVGRVEIDDVGSDPATPGAVGPGVVYQAVLESCVLKEQS